MIRTVKCVCPHCHKTHVSLVDTADQLAMRKNRYEIICQPCKRLTARKVQVTK